MSPKNTFSDKETSFVFIWIQSKIILNSHFKIVKFHEHAFFLCRFSVSHLESLKHERDALQVQLQNQKFTPADVERINREKRELQQTISSLGKSLEDAEQHKWNEEIALAKVKEKVLFSVSMNAKRSTNAVMVLWMM